MLTQQLVGVYQLPLPGHQTGVIHRHLKNVQPHQCQAALEVTNHDEKLRLQKKNPMNQLVRNTSDSEALGFLRLMQ